ncbi:hypothetical protein D3C80_812220 [compost metagenome]
MLLGIGLQTGGAECAARRQRIGKAHLCRGHRSAHLGATHVFEHGAHAKVDMLDIGCFFPCFGQKIFKRIDGRMRTAAGCIRLQHRAVDLPDFAQAFGKQFGLAGGLVIGFEKTAPYIIENAGWAGKAV